MKVRKLFCWLLGHVWEFNGSPAYPKAGRCVYCKRTKMLRNGALVVLPRRQV